MFRHLLLFIIIGRHWSWSVKSGAIVDDTNIVHAGDEISITTGSDGGSIILKIVAGDITQEKSQVVVNSRGGGGDIKDGQ